MFVRPLFLCSLFVPAVVMGCAKPQESAPSTEAAAPAARQDSGPQLEDGQDGAPGRESDGSRIAAAGRSRVGGTNLVAFRPQGDEPSAAQDDLPSEPAGETAAASDSDLALLASAIAELRASIEQLQEQNRQIMAALAINTSGQGPQLTDPAGNEPPEGTLAYTVLDLREAVEHLAAEQQATLTMMEQGTTVMKPVAPTQGVLIIENNTDSDQQVWVNGTEHRVWAQSKVTLNVPAGEVTTKLPGEAVKRWQIEAPDYREHIEFVKQ